MIYLKALSKICILLATFLNLISCTNKNELGTKENPIKISLVPGQDTKLLMENGQKLQEYLNRETHLVYEVNVPISFIAVVEALGSKRADMAIINTFGYILAKEKHGAEAALTGVYRGRDVYWGQIIARKDGPKSIKEIHGKKVAYVDPSSGSGFVLAAKLFKDEGIQPKETIFAGRHDSVVSMLYQKQVDAGATYHISDEEDGVPQDARMLVKTQFPDVFEKIVILAKTGPIPNDPVIFRKDFPEDLKKKTVQALKKMTKTPEGSKLLYELYHMDSFKDAVPAEYEKVEKMLLDLGKSAQEMVK